MFPYDYRLQLTGAVEILDGMSADLEQRRDLFSGKDQWLHVRLTPARHIQPRFLTTPELEIKHTN
jgi:hypothetical protein